MAASTDEILDEQLKDFDLGEEATPESDLPADRVPEGPETRSAQEVEAETVKPESTTPEKKETKEVKGPKVLGKLERGPDGKFVAKQLEQPQAKAQEQFLDPVIAPYSLEPETKADFIKWPRNVQEAFSKRLKQLETGYHQKTIRLARQGDFVKRIQQESAPYEQNLRMARVNPMEVYPQMLAWDHALRTDPQNALPQLAQIYGYKGTIGNGQQQQAAPQYQDTQVDKRIAALETHLQRQAQAAVIQAGNAQIEQWMNEKDDYGDPKHPYVDQLEEEMAPVVAALRRSDPGATVASILNRAYRLVAAEHPEIEGAIKQKTDARKKAASIRQSTAEAQKMRRAAISPKAPNATAPQRTIPTHDTGAIVDGLFEGTIDSIF